MPMTIAAISAGRANNRPKIRYSLVARAPWRRDEPGGLERRDGREDRRRVVLPAAFRVAHRELAEAAVAVEVLVDREPFGREPEVRSALRLVEDHARRIVGRGEHADRAGPLGRVLRLHRRLEPRDHLAVLL